MGTGYLIDSNVVIDFCNGKILPNGRSFLENIEPQISIITNIEIFATKNISQREFQLLEKFVAITTIHPLNVDLVETTIRIRQECKIKLPDAIIAATAIVFDLTLLSRNMADFKNIAGLRVIDPNLL